MKDVTIKIKSTQGLGEEKSVIEFSAEGTLEAKDGKFVISYFDDTILDGASIKTLLTAVGDKSISLEREGEINSKLLIEKGVRNNCFYSVPEGNLTLGIYGKEIENRLTASGGNIKMIYTLDADMHPISENEVQISILGR